MKVPRMSRWQVFTRVFGLVFKRCRSDFFVLLLFTLILGLIPAGMTLVSRYVFDGAYQLYNRVVSIWDYVFILCVFGALIIGQELLDKYGGLSTKRAREAISVSMLTELHEHIAQIPLEEYEDPRLFDTVHRANEVVSSNRFAYLISYMIYQPQIVLSLIATALVLAVFSPWLLLLALISIVPSFIARLVRGEQFYYLQMYRTPKQRMLGYLWSLLTSKDSIPEARLYGFDRYLEQQWVELRNEIQDEEWSFTKKDGLIQSMVDISRILGYGIGIFLAAGLMVRGRLSPGAFGAAIGGLAQVQSQFHSLLLGLASLRTNLSYISDFLICLDVPSEKEGSIGFDGLKSGIVLSDVSFGYPGTDRLVLDNINLTIPTGQSVAIVGENGEGKTTLAKLILGIYQPTCGQVQYDGEPLQVYTKQSLLPWLSAVYQDYIKYELTLRENIGFGDLRRLKDDEYIQRVANQAELSELVQTLPHGLDTQLGRLFGGSELSIGQWQRVALARGSMRDAAITVLDEPTASLDPLMEAEVFRKFMDISEGKTTMIISHRIGSARLADQIIVLKKGQVVEQGTHIELVNQKGEYARLYRLQASWYV